MIWIGIGLVLVMVGGLFGYSLFRYEDAKNVAELQKSLFEVNITPAYFNNVLALADTWLAFRLVGQSYHVLKATNTKLRVID